MTVERSKVVVVVVKFALNLSAAKQGVRLLSGAKSRVNLKIIRGFGEGHKASTECIGPN